MRACRHTDALAYFQDSIADVMAACPSKCVYLAFGDKTTFRGGIEPGYKANRKKEQKGAGGPALVQAVATEALNAVLMSARQVLVRVHPDDLPLVAEGAGEALQARGARLQADPSIQRGGSSGASDAGTVDATVENRWTRAVQALGHALPWQTAPLTASQLPVDQGDPASTAQASDTPNADA